MSIPCLLPTSSGTAHIMLHLPATFESLSPPLGRGQSAEETIPSVTNKWGDSNHPLGCPFPPRPPTTSLARTAARTPDMVVGQLLPAPRKADKRRVHLVRLTPRPALPEVRCLTLEVPARRGWRSVVNRDASAVVGFERARGVGLLVSWPGPGPGPGCGWSWDQDLPLEVFGVGAPLARRPLSVGQLAVDLRRPRGRCL